MSNSALAAFACIVAISWLAGRWLDRHGSSSLDSPGQVQQDTTEPGEQKAANPDSVETTGQSLTRPRLRDDWLALERSLRNSKPCG